MRKLFYTILVIAIANVMIMAQSASALTVSPVSLEITGDPGVTITGEIKIYNEQEGSRTFYTSFENFEPSGDSGTPHFIGANGGLATWIKSDTKIVVESGKLSVVPFSIAIPQDAEPGGHFAAIFFGNQEPGIQGDGQVSVGGKIGVLVLLRVSGAVSEGGGLSDFSTKDKQKFFSTLPVAFNYRVNNTGGDRMVPVGEITIKNTLQITSTKLPANKSEGSVLPGSARKFEVVWGPGPQVISGAEVEAKKGFFAMAKEQWGEFHFGWYAAKLNLSLGLADQTSNASYSFFIIPWQLLIIIFIILAIIGFLGRIALHRYNRFIISHASQQK